jgi:hypothetical protein
VKFGENDESNKIGSNKNVDNLGDKTLEKIKKQIYDTIFKKIEGNLIIKLAHDSNTILDGQNINIIVSIKENLTEFLENENGPCHIFKNKKGVDSPYKTHFMYISSVVGDNLEKIRFLSNLTITN